MLKAFTAYDDQTSTFIIPAGAGFEVIFCPGARSTNILATSRSQLNSLAATVHAVDDGTIYLEEIVYEYETFEKRQTQSEINIINQIPHAANSPQHVSKGSRPEASQATFALFVIAVVSFAFL